LWNQYGVEATVVGLIFTVRQRTPQAPQPFSWAEAYKCIEEAESYWRSEYGATLRLAQSLIRGQQ
jgi:hypothetical protein